MPSKLVIADYISARQIDLHHYHCKSQKGLFSFQATECVGEMPTIFTPALFRYGVVKASPALWRNVLSTAELKQRLPTIPGIDSYSDEKDFVNALSQEIKGVVCDYNSTDYADSWKSLLGVTPAFGMFRPVAIWATCNKKRMSAKTSDYVDTKYNPEAALFFAASDKPVLFNLPTLLKKAKETSCDSKELLGLLSDAAPFYIFQNAALLDDISSKFRTPEEVTDHDEIAQLFGRRPNPNVTYRRTELPLVPQGVDIVLNSEYEEQIEALILKPPFANAAMSREYRSAVTIELSNNNRLYQCFDDVLIACREVLPAQIKLSARRIADSTPSPKLLKADIISFLISLSAGLPITTRSRLSVFELVNKITETLQLHATYHGDLAYRHTEGYSELISKLHRTYATTLKFWNSGNCRNRLQILSWLIYEYWSKAARQIVLGKKVTCKIKPVNKRDAADHLAAMPLPDDTSKYVEDYLKKQKNANGKIQSKKSKSKTGTSKETASSGNQTSASSNTCAC